MKAKFLHIILIGSAIILLLNFCRKDEYFTENNAFLLFSTDTVMFDTVFTSIGSTTKRFKVLNPYQQTVKISSIVLAKGENSNFRMNVNGSKGFIIKDMEIAPNDSIFVFVEVTVDPNRDEMIEQDSIVFHTNGSTQDINLIAYGQDVHAYNQDTILVNTVWTADKPYLIYGYLMVDSLATLRIEEGCQIHLHQYGSVYVFGTLEVIGTKDAPVVFQGDRLEEMYDDIPGQWGYIHLVSGSRNNYIDYAVVKNGIIGIRADTLVNEYPTLQISNSRIENMNAVGIYGLGSRIFATNCVFANCGQFTAALTIGGYYEFFNCTMANYWSWTNRKTPSVLLNNYYQDVNGVYQIRPLIKAYFGNCIIDGSKDVEVALDSFPDMSDIFNYRFEYSFVKGDSSEWDGNSKFINVLSSGSLNFVDANGTEEYNYELDTLSVAIDAGSINIVNQYPVFLEKDINGESRTSDSAPDMGAYERIP